ncbi:uncharacterized protein EI90DRAFT_2932771 [Cantharellus anzutake]|uniref:uncharacterized protein n=1 Tax=Cantharellus anzutake TaxID=1750568 RepID=UPI00190778A4|nr:uncharacterized protein EI90DRAFT_2932771 [Cantharellus anzutake]KAF8325152.1 hypothetical protein EI90DRAFT_2932771 [Cantharellus anzutake]
MSEKVGAYGNQAKDANFRRTWNKEEYAAKAREKDNEERERMQKNDEMMKKGKKPRRHHEDLPKPTELMKQREAPLGLDKNLNKTIVVQNPGGRGPGQPGFYCEVCNRTCKDTVGYLDHLNGRSHLRRLGQTTRVARSTVEQVRARIAMLREKTKQESSAKAFDFDRRLEEIRQKEIAEREARKAEKKAARDARLIEVVQDDETANMAAMMGFGGFGSSKKN